MVKGIVGGQNLPADVTQLIDQLERHCLAPDGSLVSKSTFYDLQLARDEMSRERLRYLEAMAIYSEATAMVEEYQQAVAVANLGGIRDVQGLYPQLGLKNSPQDMAEYQISLFREIEGRLKAKCDKLANAFVIDDIDTSTGHQNSSARLPERVKLIIEEIEREEAALREDLYSADRKFAEYYNVLEQILGVLIKLVKDLKLQHQHNYDELQKTWLCKRCETMNAKLRVLEHILLLETYTQESIPALHKIRNYLVEATEEASLAYNKAVTRLREYQGVDPHFDTIARQYHDIVKKLENMQWTIRQVEMDLNRLPDHPST
ncbi:hypothetical protein CsSME_00018259 [Camellia sinensis var. sinensis]